MHLLPSGAVSLRSRTWRYKYRLKLADHTMTRYCAGLVMNASPAMVPELSAANADDESGANAEALQSLGAGKRWVTR